ncbi:MAG: lasso peptide biosynthesis B2 protein [Symploca sp. SIO2E6]|nr:lasso peptide biosynthesis B2 protein [Symploca sp. SIO2E6]
MRRLHKFIYLSVRERQLLIKTFTLLGLIRLGLWLLPFHTLHQQLVNMSQAYSISPKVVTPSIDEIVWAVDVSSHYTPGGAKCLARALTTQFLMTRHGYSPELCIGVAKGEAGKLEAHAWVKSQGEVVIGHLGNLSRFTLLPSIEKGK